MGIQYSKEGKEIINKFENLTPWEKADMVKYLADKCMTFDEIEKYFIEGNGYINYNTCDFVQEVINNDQEDEVLAEMDDTDICDYLMNNYSASYNLKYMLERMHQDDIAEAFSDLDSYFLNPFLDSMKSNYKDQLVYIKEYIDKILEDKDV